MGKNNLHNESDEDAFTVQQTLDFSSWNTAHQKIQDDPGLTKDFF